MICLNLFVIEGMDHKEIAALMVIAEGTSKSQLSKAKSLLQKNYCKMEPGMSNENLMIFTGKTNWKM